MGRSTWPNTSVALATTDETELLNVFSTHHSGHRGMTFALYSTAIAGTATVKYIEPGGGERVLSSVSVPAGGTDATIIDFDFSVPETKLYFVAASGSATTVTAEAMAY